VGFRNIIGDCDLTDIRLEGHLFTWIKSRGTSHVIEERLDRAMANTEWLSLFPNVRLLNLLTSHSDHNPILLHSKPVQRNCYQYSFKFENSWFKEEEIEEVVTRGWALDRELEITDRIGCCADEIKKWSRRKCMKFKEEVKECMEEMERFRNRHEPEKVGRFMEAQRRHTNILIDCF
jgi:hypothetical protein